MRAAALVVTMRSPLFPSAQMKSFDDPLPTEPPTVICLHSSAASGGQWKALSETLSRDFNVLTPDLHGHGAAPAWNGPPSDIVAADVARISHLAEGKGQVHLVGHSYGGAIALHAALAMPDKVASVTVFEPVAMRTLFDHCSKYRPASEIAELTRDISRDLNGGALSRAAQRFIDYWSGKGHWLRLTPERQAAIAARMRVIYAHFISLRRDVVRLADYRRIRVPVFYLVGSDTKRSTTRMSELLRSVLPRVQFMRMDAMGHLGPITHAHVVAERIAQFVRSVSGRSAAKTC